jgi:hypothetical protein
LPFRLAASAALGLVSEVFLMVELLLARGENEVRVAVNALENPVLKFRHGTILEIERRSGCLSLRLLCSPKTWRARLNRGARRSGSRILFDLPATLFPVTLPGESCLDTFFFSRLQIKRMPLDFFNDVFLLHFSFEATEGVL